MRIVYVYDAVYPYVAGGAERRNYEFGRRLARRGHEVSLVGWKYWPGASRRVEDGVVLHGVGTPPRLHDASGRRTFATALSFALRAAPIVACLGADIVDCSSIPYMPAMLLSAMGRARGVPVAVSWHEFMGERWLEYFPHERSRARLARWVERQSARFGTERIAVSAFTRERLPDGPPTRVIENGVDCDHIQAIAAMADAPDVVVAGRLVPHKRVELLLEALALLPGVTGGVIGDGPERAALEQRALGLGIRDRVTFYGQLADVDDVHAYFKGAKAVLAPSSQEGFGMTVIEAQATGVPPVVVRAQHSAAAQLIHHGVDGLTTDEDASHIADAINQLVTDRVLRNRIGRNALAAARRYDWETLATRLETAYASMLMTPATRTTELERAT